MKKQGIINCQLAGCLASLGHKDMFMVCDASMTIPAGIEVVDLAVCKGVPTFEQVLDAILVENEVEYAFLAEEMEEENPVQYKYIQKALPQIPRDVMPHFELKLMVSKMKFVVRTGEYTPYSNVVLKAGYVTE